MNETIPPSAGVPAGPPVPLQRPVPVQPPAPDQATVPVPEPIASPAAACPWPPAPPAVPPRERRLRTAALALAISAGLVFVLALVTGGVAFTLLRPGAATPEAAAEGFLHGAAGLDPLRLGRFTAPSETGPLRELLPPGLGEFTGTGDGPSLDESLRGLRDAYEVRVEDLEYELVPIADGIVRIDLRGGSLVFEGDEERVVQRMTELMRISATALDSSEEIDDRELDRQTAEAENALRDRLELPATLDIGEWARTGSAEVLGSELGSVGLLPILVAVQEGGRWYVSPMLSAVEMVIASWPEDFEDLKRGTRVIEGRGHAGPHEAADAWLAGLEELMRSGDHRELAEASALPERRLLSLYGPMVFGHWRGLREDDIEVRVRGEFRLEQSPGRTLLLPDPVEIRLLRHPAPGSFGDAVSVRFDSDCVSSDDSSEQTFCLSDWWPQQGPFRGAFGALRAVEERDGWRIGLLPVIHYPKG